MESIPSRFSEKQFNRYADQITAVLKHWPAAIEVYWSEGSIETVSARLRDAIKAGVRYGYSLGDAELDTKLATIGNKICVSMREGFIVAGPRDAVKNYRRGLATQQTTKVERLTLDFRFSHHDTLEFCRIINDYAHSRIPIALHHVNPETLAEAGRLCPNLILEETTDKDCYTLL